MSTQGNASSTFLHQLFDRQGFNDKGALWVSSPRTKKTFFTVIPAVGEGAGLCEHRNLLSR